MTTLQTFEGSFPPSLLSNDHQMSPTDRTDDMKTTAHQKNDHIDWLVKQLIATQIFVSLKVATVSCSSNYYFFYRKSGKVI